MELLAGVFKFEEGVDGLRFWNDSGVILNWIGITPLAWGVLSLAATQPPMVKLYGIFSRAGGELLARG